jgi:DNA-binding GntR family transcriptional regulator
MNSTMSHSVLSIRREPSLTIKIYEALTERIVAGELRPGDPIIIEQVAAMLEVSPTPVRESLARLAEQGVITKGRNGRMSVLQLTPDYVRDSYIVRGALEGLAAELATPRLSDEAIATLHHDVADILAHTIAGNFGQYMVAIDELYNTIETAADSPTLSRELSVLRFHTAFIRSRTRRYFPEKCDNIHHEIRVLVDALTSRDPDAARRAAVANMTNAAHRVAALLQQRGEFD